MPEGNECRAGFAAMIAIVSSIFPAHRACALSAVCLCAVREGRHCENGHHVLIVA
jgi:hypothetical protein